jgi:hypothetical protein
VKVVQSKRPELLLLDKGGGGAHLLVVTDDQHLLCPQKGGQRRDIGLRSLIKDHKIEGGERGREALGNPPTRHDPARHGRIGGFHRIARVSAEARSAFAGAFTDPADGGEEHLQGRVYPPRYSRLEREQRPQPDDIVEEPPYLVVGGSPLLIQLAKPSSPVDRTQVRIGLSPDPGATPVVRRQAVFDAFNPLRAERLSPIGGTGICNCRRHAFNGVQVRSKIPHAAKLGEERGPFIGDGGRRSVRIADRSRQKLSDCLGDAP